MSSWVGQHCSSTRVQVKRSDQDRDSSSVISDFILSLFDDHQVSLGDDAAGAITSPLVVLPDGARSGDPSLIRGSDA
jgi:hypothetical protein